MIDFHEDGVLPVDKPEGISSFDVIRNLKKGISPRKIGHAGTLDPFASGVILICINQATKLSNLLMEGIKIYQGRLHLGIETDTGDPTGRITSQVPDKEIKSIPFSSLDETFKGLVGSLAQSPPMYSAAKHKGRPLYTYARQGKTVPRRKKKVVIYSIKVNAFQAPFAEFLLECSKGTYVRSIAVEVGKRLGVGAHLSSLKRLRSGTFHLKDCLSLDDPEMCLSSSIKTSLIPLSDLLPDIPVMRLSNSLADKVRKGYQLKPKDINIGNSPESIKRGEMVRLINESNHLVAIARFKNDVSGEYYLKTERVFT